MKFSWHLFSRPTPPPVRNTEANERAKRAFDAQADELDVRIQRLEARARARQRLGQADD